jgi:hypothetical protein
MDEDVERAVHQLIKGKMLDKVNKYAAETDHKPFYERMFSKEDLVKASILQSVYTTFGMSVWEQVAVKLSRGAGYEAERQHKLEGEVDRETENLINHIHKQLKKKEREPDRENELEEIKESIENVDNPSNDHPDRVVDVYIKTDDGKEYLIDITTVKPNKKEFQTLKKKLLTWMALRLSQDEDAEVYPAIAIPYNPYGHGNEYERWTKEELYDRDGHQLIVGADFWNLVAGEEVYDDLLETFEDVGDEIEDQLRELLDDNQTELEEYK